MNNKSNSEDLEDLIKRAGYDLDDPETFQIQSKEDLLRMIDLHGLMIANIREALKSRPAYNRAANRKEDKKQGVD